MDGCVIKDHPQLCDLTMSEAQLRITIRSSLMNYWIINITMIPLVNISEMVNTDCKTMIKQLIMHSQTRNNETDGRRPNMILTKAIRRIEQVH